MTAHKMKIGIAAAALLTVSMSVLGSAAVAQNATGSSGVRQSAAASPVAATPNEQITLVQFAGPNAPPQKLTLVNGKGAVVEVDRDVRDVFAADPSIVDAVVRTPRRIFITSGNIGTTNVILLDPNGVRLGTLEVRVIPDINELNVQIARQLPGSRIRAEALNDSIVLNGTVASATQASQAQQMARQLVPQQSEDRVVNGLRIEQATQVMIKVRVAEMGRTIAKQFGVNATAAIGRTDDGVPIFASTSNQFSLLGKALSSLSGARVGAVGLDCLTSALLDDCLPSNSAAPTNVQGVVQALERVGLVRTLAEPNLTAVSGEAARFLVGGEFPIPTSRDRDGGIVVTFKPFGVGLAFTPVVLDKGHISLQISTEVSELTNTGAYTIEGPAGQGGITVPALAVRRAETTVELPSGGSLVIGGLLQQSAKQNIDGLPGLKDLPILGALFRSRDFQNNETELVVMVTAYLVDPVAEARLARPDTGFALPTDLETILQGRLNAVYGRGASQPVAGAPRSTVGYIIE